MHRYLRRHFAFSAAFSSVRFVTLRCRAAERGQAFRSVTVDRSNTDIILETAARLVGIDNFRQRLPGDTDVIMCVFCARLPRVCSTITVRAGGSIRAWCPSNTTTAGAITCCTRRARRRPNMCGQAPAKRCCGNTDRR